MCRAKSLTAAQTIQVHSMPELPEVETTKRGIASHVTGKIIKQVIIRESRMRWPIPNDLPQLLQKHTLRSVSRRAKYLLFELDHGFFMLHLGMSGSLRIVDSQTPLQKHDHVDFCFNQKTILRFNDPRRFGSVLWLGKTPFEHALLSALGPEPFDERFTGDYLFKQSRKKKLAAKSFIMDNHTVVGVGNIYANEALFMSGVRPGRAAGRLSKAQCDKLAAAIVKVLGASIEMGGTTLRDFVGGDGKPGYFQQTLRVYDRAGKACRQCGTSIKLTRMGQRSTYYCPQCQH